MPPSPSPPAALSAILGKRYSEWVTSSGNTDTGADSVGNVLEYLLHDTQRDKDKGQQKNKDKDKDQQKDKDKDILKWIASSKTDTGAANSAAVRNLK